MVTQAQASYDNREQLGRDIRMSNDGDIAISSSNDFSFINFDSNLSQAILNRIKTSFGEYPMHTNYGTNVSRYFGESFNDNTLQRVKVAVREGLLQEPRVSEILNIRTWFDNESSGATTRINVEIVVVPIEETEPLNLVYSLFV